MKQLLLAAMIATATLGWTMPAQAVTCGSSGFGDESCSTPVNCASGASLQVQASVDETGWVNGKNQCSDKTASCSGSLSCSGSASGQTSQAGSGSCSGSGNGGWWTVLYVACTGVIQESSPLQDLLGSYLRTTGMAGGLTPELSGILAGVSDHSAWILGSGGVTIGVACNDGACVPVPAVCTVLGSEWSCRV